MEGEEGEAEIGKCVKQELLIEKGELENKCLIRRIFANKDIIILNNDG